jgi:hypothetical protein
MKYGTQGPKIKEKGKSAKSLGIIEGANMMF